MTAHHHSWVPRSQLIREIVRVLSVVQGKRLRIADHLSRNQTAKELMNRRLPWLPCHERFGPNMTREDLKVMALPPKKDTPQIVRTMTPLTGTVRGGTLLTGRTMSYRRAQHEVECKDISRPSRGRDCGIEEDERSDGPLS